MDLSNNKDYLGVINKTDNLFWKILIVDDSHFQQDQIERILISEKFLVVGKADTGEKSIEMYEQYKPDIVIMDIQMPGIGGIEATKKILELDNKALIIACTTLSNKNIVQKAILSGCKHYIVKPVKRNLLLEAIKKILIKFKK